MASARAGARAACVQLNDDVRSGHECRLGVDSSCSRAVGGPMGCRPGRLAAVPDRSDRGGASLRYSDLARRSSPRCRRSSDRCAPARGLCRPNPSLRQPGGGRLRRAHRVASSRRPPSSACRYPDRCHRICARHVGGHAQRGRFCRHGRRCRGSLDCARSRCHRAMRPRVPPGCGFRFRWWDEGLRSNRLLAVVAPGAEQSERTQPAQPRPTPG